MYNIISAGIDHSIASLAVREKFSLTKAKQIEFYKYLKTVPEILGGTIISTCNRTELYLSLAQNATCDPFLLLLNFLNIEKDENNLKYKIYCGKDVIYHLCMLACGAKSQIFGEDQIISQIKTSIILSRECDMTDSIMEVLFRTGITCGKKIKTQLNMTKRETSIADFVIEKLESDCKNVKDILVIGNGEMGRHMAEKLITKGYNVTMSVREYLHAKVVLPSGACGVDYAKIYSQMECSDAVVSATLSPHYTVRFENFTLVQNKPKYLFDLAVPRDISPEILKIENIKIWDVDMLSAGKTNEDRESLLTDMKKIIEKYIADFEKWNEFKKKIIIFEE